MAAALSGCRRSSLDELYDRVYNGEETKIVLEANSASDYREKLTKELAEIGDSECGGPAQPSGPFDPKEEKRNRITPFKAGFSGDFFPVSVRSEPNVGKKGWE